MLGYVRSCYVGYGLVRLDWVMLGYVRSCYIGYGLCRLD